MEKSTEINKESKLIEGIKRMVIEQPLGTAGAVITMIMVLIAIFANYLAPYGLNQMTGYDHGASISQILDGHR